MKMRKIFSLLLLCVMVLSGCANVGGYVEKEYTLPTETVAQIQQNINLEDYRIQEGAVMALGDLINIKGMVLESVCFYDDDNLVMIFLNEDGTRLDTYLFSLQNASLSWMGTIENLTKIEGVYSSYSVVSVSPLVIMDEYTNSIWVIKDKMVQQTISLDLMNVHSVVIGNSKAYYTHTGNDAIESIDLTSGQVDTIYTGLNEYGYSISKVTQVSEDGQYLYAVGVNRFSVKDTTFVIDLEQNKLVAEVEGMYDCWNSNDYMYSSSVEGQKYIVHQRDEDNYTDVTVGEIAPYGFFEYFITEGDLAITEENEGGIYTFTYYDLTEMKKIKSTNIDIHTYFMYKHSQECSYSYCSINENFGYNADRNMLVFMVRTDTGLSNVFLWDIENATKDGAALPGVDYIEEMDFQYVNEIDYDELSDLVHIIYDKYGIAIYMGANTPGTFTDFTAVKEENLDVITGALADVQEILACYPEDFFRFFTEDEYLKGINVYLVGNITTISEGYTDNPMGFANVSQGYEVIAINVNYAEDIKATLVHEISHAIFERIKYEEGASGTVYFDEEKWSTFNPEGFSYYNAYVDSNGKDITSQNNGEYTAELYKDDASLENIYFIDDYSKTFLTEDLARLMQYGMVASDEDFMSSPKLIAKLNYYYSAIRSVWDSEDWPAKTEWENNLSK